jgi:hypothetical protein
MHAPVVRSQAELLKRLGQRVSVAGRYEIADLDRHRVVTASPDGTVKDISRIAVLVLEDGCRVRLWVRPEQEMEGMEGRMAVVTGKAYLPAQAGERAAQAQPAPALVEIRDVRPAE